jgi:hypothetical protein
MHAGDPLVWLMHAQVDGTAANDLYLANYPRDLSYDLNDGGGLRTWTRTRWELRDIGEEKGVLADVQVTVSNVDRAAQRRLERQEVLDRRVRLFRVRLSTLGTAGHHEEFTYEAKGASCDEQGVTFQLGTFPYLEFPFPGDRFLHDACRFIYKGADGRCAATFAGSTCDKSFAGTGGCAGRTNQHRFGGFPHLLRGYHPFLP